MRIFRDCRQATRIIVWKAVLSYQDEETLYQIILKREFWRIEVCLHITLYRNIWWGDFQKQIKEHRHSIFSQSFIKLNQTLREKNRRFVQQTIPDSCFSYLIRFIEHSKYCEQLS
jgi:uncharacterized damage-inducible protein DinB